MEHTSSSPSAQCQTFDEWRTAWAVRDAEIRRTIKSFWISKQNLLASKGYTLGQELGWELTRAAAPDLNENYPDSESNSESSWEYTADAWNSNGQHLRIRQVSVCSPEPNILRALSTPSMLANPRNPCVPLIELFNDKQNSPYTFIVTPHLIHYLPCELVDDFLEYGGQVLDGLAFLHEHGITNFDFGLCSRCIGTEPDDSRPGPYKYYFCNFRDANWSPTLLGRTPPHSVVRQPAYARDLRSFGKHCGLEMTCYTNLTCILQLSLDMLDPDGPPDIATILERWRDLRSSLSYRERYWPLIWHSSVRFFTLIHETHAFGLFCRNLLWPWTTPASFLLYLIS